MSKNNFGSEKNVGSEKHVEPEKNFGTKKIFGATISFLVCSVIVDFGGVLLMTWGIWKCARKLKNPGEVRKKRRKKMQ